MCLVAPQICLNVHQRLPNVSSGSLDTPLAINAADQDVQEFSKQDDSGSVYQEATTRPYLRNNSWTEGLSQTTHCIPDVENPSR